MKTQSTFLILLFLTTVSISQSIYLGGAIGYGKYFIGSNPNLKQLFDKENGKDFVASFLIGYKPGQAIFCFNSGLNYQTMFAEQQTINSIQMPLVMEFELGKTYQVLLGFGLYGQYLLSQKNVSYNNITTFQLGFRASIGFGYNLNKKLDLFIKFQDNNDITRLFRSRRPTHIGTIAYDNYYLYSYNINIGVRYKIK